MAEWLFLTVPWGCLRFVIMVFPDYTHLLFLIEFRPMVKEEITLQTDGWTDERTDE